MLATKKIGDHQKEKSMHATYFVFENLGFLGYMCSDEYKWKVVSYTYEVLDIFTAVSFDTSLDWWELT